MRKPLTCASNRYVIVPPDVAALGGRNRLFIGLKYAVLGGTFCIMFFMTVAWGTRIFCRVSVARALVCVGVPPWLIHSTSGVVVAVVVVFRWSAPFQAMTLRLDEAPVLLHEGKDTIHTHNAPNPTLA